MSDNSPEAVRALVAGSPFHTWFGMRVTDIADGTCEVSLDATDHHHNLVGTTHGGVISTLADTAIGLATRTRLPDGARHLTTHLGVTYLDKPGAGTLVARGRCLRMGRRFAYGEADVVDAKGRLVARATATFAVLA